MNKVEQLILGDLLSGCHSLLLERLLKLLYQTNVNEVIKVGITTLLYQRRQLWFDRNVPSCLGGTKYSLMSSVCPKFMSFRCVELVVIVLAKEQLLGLVPGNCPLLLLVISSSYDSVIIRMVTRLPWEID